MFHPRPRCARMTSAVVVTVVAAIIAVLPARAAVAALMLNMPDVGVSVTDNGAADSDSATGRLIQNTDVAGFGVAITVAASNSPGVAASGGLLQVQSLTIRNNNPGVATIVLEVTDSGFTFPGGAAGTSLDLDSTAAGTFTFGAAGDSLSFRSFVNPANGTPLPPLGQAAPALNFTRVGGGFQETFTLSSSTDFTRGGGPYSLGARLSATLSPGAQLSVSGTTLASVPEPGAPAVIAGCVLVRVMAVRRHRDRRHRARRRAARWRRGRPWRR